MVGALVVMGMMATADGSSILVPTGNSQAIKNADYMAHLQHVYDVFFDSQK